MWAMTPQTMFGPNNSQGVTSQTVHTPGGSSTVYVHHINHQSPPPPPPLPQQPVQVGIPFGCAHFSPPMQPYYPYSYPQPQAPTVVVVNAAGDHKSGGGKGGGGDGDKKGDASPKPPSPKPPKGPQKFSPLSTASIIIFLIGLIMGIVCVVKTYGAYEHRQSETTDREAYIICRTVALGTGAAGTMCFTISTLLSFYAGTHHKMKNEDKKGSCCLGGFLIAGWIIFCLTFINNLVIMVLAFDDDNVIYPELVWSALIGSMLSWMLMFGFSEMARRA